MFDGTYKLNNARMPLVILLIVDGNGESQIAGLTIVKSENEDTFLQFFEEFKKENVRHGDIEVIMSDNWSLLLSVCAAIFTFIFLFFQCMCSNVSLFPNLKGKFFCSS